MSEEIPVFSVPEFTPRNARLTSDPPAEWRNNNLYITVYRKNTENIQVSESELERCKQKAKEKGVGLEKAIKDLKLIKAGKVNYEELKATQRLPLNPDIPDVTVDNNRVFIRITPEELEGQKLSKEEKQEAKEVHANLPKEQARERFLKEKLAKQRFEDLVKSGALPAYALFSGETTLHGIDLIKAGAKLTFSKPPTSFKTPTPTEYFSPKFPSGRIFTFNQDETEVLQEEEEEEELDSSQNTIIETEDSTENEYPNMAGALVKGKWDRLKGKIEDLKTDCRESVTAPLTIDELEVNLANVENYYEELEKVVDDYATTVPMEIATINKEYKDLVKTLRDLRVSLKSSLRKKAEGQPKQNSPGGGPGESTIRLPRLELPKFDGKPESWLNCKDLFKTSVLDQQIADAQKLQMLKSLLLPGPALDTIKHVPTTGTNLSRAWKSLCDKFDDERKLKQIYLDKLSNLQPAHNIAGLIKVFEIANDSREALRVLNVDVDNMNSIFIHAVVKCFDKETRKLYEILQASARTQNSSYEENWKTLSEFIRMQGSAQESTKHSKPGPSHGSPGKRTTSLTTTAPRSAKSPQCSLCRKDHIIARCEKFREMSLSKRRDVARERQLCFNCLFPGHRMVECKSKRTCRFCDQNHHSLLHPETAPEKPKEVAQTSSFLTVKPQCNRTVLLPTAVILVTSVTGEKVPLRALLDSGSQTTFITEHTVSMLGLPRKASSMAILGIGGRGSQSTKGCVELKFASRTNSSFEVTTEGYVLPKITEPQPSTTVMFQNWEHLQNLQLADPQYYKPNKIDILLSADITMLSLTQGKRITGRPDEPIGTPTKFGYLVTGKAAQETASFCHLATEQENISQLLQRFWEVEDCPQKSLLTSEEEQSEKEFRETTTRADNGKFVVAMPFKTDKPDLGSSRQVALRRLQGQEQRLARNPELKTQYSAFMKEYLELGHMTEVKDEPSSTYYFPHHAVVRTSALTTKLRVVFDGSAKSSNGKSLNDNQIMGPVIQDDLVSIILRFRLHRVVLNGDISMMYRQIYIRPDQRDWQRILWRFDPQEEVKSYRLNTVTYGTKNAPWLATRCLKQIADDVRDTHPKAARVIEKSFYMDDLLHGSDSRKEAIKLQEEISSILKQYGFELRKWASNEPMVINAIKNDLCQQKLLTNPENVIKTLGVKWDRERDSFSFTVSLAEKPAQTKRELLSEIAKIFDPLGWASPVIITAKQLFQELWITGIDWDDAIPEQTRLLWNEFRTQLPLLEQVHIPRWMDTMKDSNIELHGFADASQKAYGAVVYLRTTTGGIITSHIMAAKTRVAPVKIITLPRLELQAAMLLANLVKHVKEALERPQITVHCWTDSTVTLGWIYSDPGKYATFVANRIAGINDIVPRTNWHHVRSQDNPADVASRGILPEELGSHELWFRGPSWLTEDYTSKFGTCIEEPAVERKKTKTSLVATTTTDIEWMERFSSLQKLLGVTAIIMRWSRNRKKLVRSQAITSEERREAFHRIAAQTQKQYFPLEYKSKGSLGILPKRSKLLSLSPIWDEDLQLMRVGGRLENTQMSWEERHPIIMPKCHLMTLLLRELHVENMHADLTLLIASARQKVWILRARDIAKKVIRQCITCTKWKAKTYQQIMASLPRARTEAIFPFNRVGIDYAGPLEIKTRTGRGGSVYKGWICLFVCMSTKAIHLELVTSLSTEGFIAALKRFVSRRGYPAHIHCDNGSNFVGAKKELRNLVNQAEEQLKGSYTDSNIQWHRIPPGAPHFGGLWEAGVKSVKYHLRRVLGDKLLTFEELTTVLTGIEACLNSRPLGRLSDDPSDLNILTPGHFLIGRPLNSVPNPDLLHLKENTLSRWQLCQKSIQHFWQRWHTEYLSSLQARTKWKTEHINAKEGDLVLILEENSPPTKWRTGLILKVHPGKDGKVRSATIRTSKGAYERPVIKLVPILGAMPQGGENDGEHAKEE